MTSFNFRRKEEYISLKEKDITDNRGKNIKTNKQRFPENNF